MTDLKKVAESGKAKRPYHKKEGKNDPKKGSGEQMPDQEPPAPDFEEKGPKTGDLPPAPDQGNDNPPPPDQGNGNNEPPEPDFKTPPAPLFTPTIPRRKRKNLISGAIFWNFIESPVFVGTYTGECHNDEGELIGYNFADENGELWVLGKNYAIERALNSLVPGTDTPVSEKFQLLEITFLGKVKRKAGGEFSRFRIDMLE